MTSKSAIVRPKTSLSQTLLSSSTLMLPGFINNDFLFYFPTAAAVCFWQHRLDPSMHHCNKDFPIYSHKISLSSSRRKEDSSLSFVCPCHQQLVASSLPPLNGRADLYFFFWQQRRNRKVKRDYTTGSHVPIPVNERAQGALLFSIPC